MSKHLMKTSRSSEWHYSWVPVAGPFLGGALARSPSTPPDLSSLAPMRTPSGASPPHRPPSSAPGPCKYGFPRTVSGARAAVHVSFDFRGLCPEHWGLPAHDCPVNYNMYPGHDRAVAVGNLARRVDYYYADILHMSEMILSYVFTILLDLIFESAPLSLE